LKDLNNFHFSDTLSQYDIERKGKCLIQLKVIFIVMNICTKAHVCTSKDIEHI